MATRPPGPARANTEEDAGSGISGGQHSKMVDDTRTPRIAARTQVLVTKDGDAAYFVDLSAASSPAAIKERIYAKLGIYDDEHARCRVSRARAGQAIGQPLDDWQLWDLCIRAGLDPDKDPPMLIVLIEGQFPMAALQSPHVGGVGAFTTTSEPGIHPFHGSNSSAGRMSPDPTLRSSRPRWPHARNGSPTPLTSPQQTRHGAVSAQPPALSPPADLRHERGGSLTPTAPPLAAVGGPSSPASPDRGKRQSGSSLSSLDPRQETSGRPSYDDNRVRRPDDRTGQEDYIVSPYALHSRRPSEPARIPQLLHDHPALPHPSQMYNHRPPQPAYTHPSQRNLGPASANVRRDMHVPKGAKSMDDLRGQGRDGAWMSKAPALPNSALRGAAPTMPIDQRPQYPNARPAPPPPVRMPGVTFMGQWPASNGHALPNRSPYPGPIRGQGHPFAQATSSRMVPAASPSMSQPPRMPANVTFASLPPGARPSDRFAQPGSPLPARAPPIPNPALPSTSPRPPPRPRPNEPNARSANPHERLPPSLPPTAPMPLPPLSQPTFNGQGLSIRLGETLQDAVNRSQRLPKGVERERPIGQLNNVRPIINQNMTAPVATYNQAGRFSARPSDDRPDYIIGTHFYSTPHISSSSPQSVLATARPTTSEGKANSTRSSGSSYNSGSPNRALPPLSRDEAYGGADDHRPRSPRSTRSSQSDPLTPATELSAPGLSTIASSKLSGAAALPEYDEDGVAKGWSLTDHGASPYRVVDEKRPSMDDDAEHTLNGSNWMKQRLQEGYDAVLDEGEATLRNSGVPGSSGIVTQSTPNIARTPNLFYDDDDDDFEPSGTYMCNMAPSISATSATHDSRPKLTLQTDTQSSAVPVAPNTGTSPPKVDASLSVTAAGASASSSVVSPVQRRKSLSQPDADWAFRPAVDQVYENLEDFFPDHDLDKPIDIGPIPIEINSPASPADAGLASSSSSSTPISRISPARIKGRARSIRVVAQEKKHLLRSSEERDKARAQKSSSSSALSRGSRNGSALLRRKSTKLWGARTEEVVPGQSVSLANKLDGTSEDDPANFSFKWVKGELIGQGSFGHVYLALNATNGEMLAVKQVGLPTTISDRNDVRQQQVVDALKSEISLMRDLEHPNIVQYLGFEETTVYLSIFLEYVPGGSVGSCLRKHGAFELPVIQHFTTQVLEGLTYLHLLNILHRDLKADNLLVDMMGICKISDFGISKRSDRIYEDNTQMSLQGSIYWMAPEVVHNPSKKGYSAKVDIWSLGCVVLEMFAGRRPWSDAEAVQAMFKIGAERQRPPLPADVTLGRMADHFLGQCFFANPDDRPTAKRLADHRFLEMENHWKFEDSKLYRAIKPHVKNP